jgi:hypothetical protein
MQDPFLLEQSELLLGAPGVAAGSAVRLDYAMAGHAYLHAAIAVHDIAHGAVCLRPAGAARYFLVCEGFAFGDSGYYGAHFCRK